MPPPAETFEEWNQHKGAVLEFNIKVLVIVAILILIFRLFRAVIEEYV
jgi:hypothetical protein